MAKYGESFGSSSMYVSILEECLQFRGLDWRGITVGYRSGLPMQYSGFHNHCHLMGDTSCISQI